MYENTTVQLLQIRLHHFQIVVRFNIFSLLFVSTFSACCSFQHFQIVVRFNIFRLLFVSAAWLCFYSYSNNIVWRLLCVIHSTMNNELYVPQYTNNRILLLPLNIPDGNQSSSPLPYPHITRTYTSFQPILIICHVCVCWWYIVTQHTNNICVKSRVLSWELKAKNRDPLPASRHPPQRRQ